MIDIPSLDPIPLPAPVWLLRTLLVVTFILHLVPMNFALGGGFLAAISQTFGKWRKSERHLLLAGALWKMVPYTIAAAITLGVAPLLFLQVLYGQFFYTSSVLMAWPWLSVVGLLTLGYYGFYRCYFRAQQKRPVSLWVPWGSAFLFLTIGFLYTHNMVLMLTPEKWQGIYTSSAYGIHLSVSDPTIIPRFLHFFIASLALSGILVMLHGFWKKKTDDEQGKWAIRYGSQWFVAATFVQFFIGLWFLAALPPPVRNSLMGQDKTATAILVAAIICAVLSLILILLAGVSEKPFKKTITGAVLISVTVALMAVIRDFVRAKYLEPYFDAAQQAVRPQWDVFAIFAVLLVAGVITVVWIILKVIKER
ncbi:MAG: hypothetical protein HYS56_00610 [Candidatus Omnitrophica bacterium]|nr:hypothetical protein [Candidatus Omnitrophota bacterium]